MGDQTSLTVIWGVLSFTMVTTNPAVAIAGIAGLTVCFVATAIAGTVMAQTDKRDRP